VAWEATEYIYSVRTESVNDWAETAAQYGIVGEADLAACGLISIHQSQPEEAEKMVLK
jgi:hypothetical protein